MGGHGEGHVSKRDYTVLQMLRRILHPPTIQPLQLSITGIALAQSLKSTAHMTVFLTRAATGTDPISGIR